ncbi:MAG: PrsW family glutamic-type intramembrane protease [Treponema sp.]|nr:PrsW family glutamic-type intramembrane protease [Treponema sp.]
MIGVLIVLILISAIPAGAAFLWFRLSRYPFSPRMFLISLLVGATSLFIALFLQNFLASIGILPPLTDRRGLFVEIFVRIAFTEEISRFLLLIPMFLVFRRFNQSQGKEFPEGISADTMGKAAGLIVGLGFGILESAIYGASYPRNALLRAFTAAPLHAACGSRVGSSVMLFRENSTLAVFQFLSAVAIHGLYNLLLVTPGQLSPWIAILVAISALVSSIQAISRGMRMENGE